MKTDLLNGSKALVVARQEADTWNIFVQILLPLIIVLCFVAMLEIARFRNGFMERGEVISKMEAERRAFEETNEGQRALAYQRQFLDLQRQKLILASEVVFNDERRRLGFDHVANGQSVKLEGTTVSDEAFKSLCANLADLDSNTASYEHWERKLFNRILERANVRPRTSSRGVREGISLNAVDVEEISDDNQRLVLDEVRTKGGTIFRDLTVIQQEVLTRIFVAKALVQETADPRILDIAHRIAAVRDNERDRERAVRDMLQYLNERMQESLEANGYRFLKRTWASIRQ